MTADVELLPCPFCGSAEPIVAEPPEILPLSFQIICSGIGCNAVVESRTLARAKLMWNRRANVAHATAAKDAEVEALRAEVGDYRMNGAAAVRFAPNSAYWSNELRRLFGDDARTGIEVLENQYRQELARAERLAEALRGWWKAHRPVGWTEDQHRARPYVNLITVADKALTEVLLRDQED